MLYAAYGSNLHPLRLQARVPSARFLGTSLLPGWALKFHKRGTDGSGKGSIVAADSAVHVAVYDVSDDGLSTLDDIEGLDTGYRRAMIEVPDFRTCCTYLAEPSHIDESLEPYDWYREIVLLGCRAMTFPDDYVARVSEVVAREDPDADRRRANWAIVERLRSARQAAGGPVLHRRDSRPRLGRRSRKHRSDRVPPPVPVAARDRGPCRRL